MRAGSPAACGLVGEWSTRRRRSEQIPDGALGQVPSARRLARLLTITRDGLTKADAVVVATVETGVPALT